MNSTVDYNDDLGIKVTVIELTHDLWRYSTTEYFFSKDISGTWYIFEKKIVHWQQVAQRRFF